MERWQVARVEEIEEVTDGRCAFRPVREHFGIHTFGITSWTGRTAGDRLINEHDEAEAVDGDELYLVTDGRARFEIDGATVEASAGTYVAVAAGVMRTAFAETAGTTLVAIGGGPGGGVPYQPWGWELWSKLRAAFDAGDHAQVIEQARELLADDPPYPIVYYNVACSASRLGRREDALTHLRRAIELSPEFAAYARQDDDLAAIRDEPEFARITAV